MKYKTREHPDLAPEVNRFLKLIQVLPVRDVNMLSLRYNENMTYEHIAETYNVSTERVRQILDRVKKQIVTNLKTHE